MIDTETQRELDYLRARLILVEDVLEVLGNIVRTALPSTAVSFTELGKDWREEVNALKKLYDKPTE